MRKAVSRAVSENATSGERSDTARRTFTQIFRGDLGPLPIILTLIVIVAYFTISTDGVFLKPNNLSDLLQQIVTIGVDGLGISLVLLLGEIDLSVAAVGTLGAVVTGICSTRLGVNPWLSMGAGVLTGATAGFVNGFFTAVLRVPSFIVTLAALIGYSGLVLYLLGGQSTLIVHDATIVSIAGTPYSFLPDYLGVGLPTLLLAFYAIGLVIEQRLRGRKGLHVRPNTQLAARIAIPALVVGGAVFILMNTPSPTPGLYLGIPNNVAILFGLIFMVWLVMTRTRFGRYVYAVGGNSEAARRAGINVTMVRITVFTCCSALAAVGGILATSRSNAVDSQINPTLLLDAIAAAVIGGVSLFGGRGSIWAVALGALIIGSLENGMSLRSQGTDIKQMVEGAVLVLAVTVDALVRRVQARTGR